MGLDMYLQTIPKNKIPKDYIEFCKYSDDAWNSHKKYERTLMDWRKANQIHHWFCENCKCLKPEVLYMVTVEDLSKLCATMEKVLKNHKKAPLLLPTCQGFFYGSQEYDEWYFDELEYSLKHLKEIIEAIKEDGLLEKKTLIYYANW